MGGAASYMRLGARAVGLGATVYKGSGDCRMTADASVPDSFVYLFRRGALAFRGVT